MNMFYLSRLAGARTCSTVFERKSFRQSETEWVANTKKKKKKKPLKLSVCLREVHHLFVELKPAGIQIQRE